MQSELKVEQWPIDRPIPYARNPRKNDAAVDKVAASIKEFGFRQPIVVDGAGVIIAGHTRYKAARKLGRKCYGLEIAPGYCAVILERMVTAFPQLDMHKLPA